jgi:hypothetical protein
MSEISDTGKERLITKIECASEYFEMMKQLREKYPAPEGHYYATGYDNKLHIYPLGEDDE